MKRSVAGLILAIALGLLVAPLAAAAQQQAKVPRVGYLGGIVYMLDAFLEGLRQRGYVEGRNIIIERRSPEGKNDRFPDLVAELVRLKVDIIVASGLQAALAAKNATTTIPIVFISNDPVGVGLVASLARPGGNITGLSIIVPDLSGKMLELLKEAVPGVTRVAVLWVSSNPGLRLAFNEMGVAARTLGVELQSVDVRDPTRLEGTFAAITRGRAGAVIVFPDPVTFFHRQRILDFAAKSRLPSMYYGRELVEAGGLISYGVSWPALYQRAATYVDKILKGAKPADLPVEQPMRFELVVNMKTAKALGITFPPTILIRADQVIQIMPGNGQHLRSRRTGFRHGPSHLRRADALEPDGPGRS